ncbi:MAG: phage shock protein operon transcriptional activator [Pseudomonadota bacterium]
MQTNIIGESFALTETLDRLSHLATINRSVLVLGERGTGKELAAERLHFLSGRWEAPFIKVNCAAMAETLLESELFGHEAGAFTGATRAHTGRFERADRGTLFLDEVGTMSPRLQEKLLRLIEYGEFERVGGQKTLKVDVRVVAATNADLLAMTKTQEFRADLLDRLSFDVVHMPALRVRDDDILLLAEHFAVAMSAELGWEFFPGFSERANAQLKSYPWPGNVRELKNAVERSLHRWSRSDEPVDALIIDPFLNPWADESGTAAQESPKASHAGLAHPSDGLKASDSTAGDQHNAHHQTPSGRAGLTPGHSTADPIDFKNVVDNFEKQLLLKHLTAHDYNQRECAEHLNLSYNQIRGLVRKYDIHSRPRRA